MSATYYVSATGNDGAAGTSPGTAWRTLTPVNAHTFVPGDTVLFEGGSTFTGGLYIHNVASNSANPVTLGSYGTGKATISTAAGTTGAYIYQMGGVVVQNLNLTGPGASTANQAGILFYNDAVSTFYPYIRVTNCTVTGYTNGISVGGGNGTSGYSDIQITHCDCHANQLNGIFFFGAANYCHSGVYVGYCNAYSNLGKAGLSNNSGSGILLGSVNGGTVEYCLAHDNGANNTYISGPVGIWCYASNNVTIQYCESYNNSTGAGGGDGDGFDLDGGCTDCIIQYCYSHGNEGAGFCLFQYAGASTFANNIIRYCISENDGYAGIGLWGASSSDKITNSQIYNNTIFAGLSPGLLAYNSNLSGIVAKNNIFIATGGHALVDHPGNVGITFDHNLYFAKSGAFLIWWNGTSYSSLGAWGQDAAGLSADPQLANSGGGGTIGDATLLGTLLAYKILSFFSPVVDAGAIISSPGTTDFYGNNLFYGAPDIGANEYYPPLTPSLTQANPLPGTAVASSALVTPGGGQGIQGVAGPQGPTGAAGGTSVSANANNKATLGSDSLVLVQGTAVGVAATTHAQTVSGDDPQLTNARTPTAHALDSALHSATTDITTLNASSTAHGLLVKVSGTATDFVGGDNACHAHSTVALDTLGATTDITTRNASATAHGLLCKVSNVATDFVGGDNLCHAHSTVALDTLGATTDIPTLNASTTAHGLLKKLSNAATQYMDGTGNWSVPVGAKPFKVFQAAVESSPPATLYAVFNTQNNRSHLEFADAATNGAYFFGVIPQGVNLASGLLVRLKWKAVVSSPTGNVRWNVAFERLNTAESADSFDTAVPFTSAVGAQSVIVEAAITVTTIDGLTAGDGFGLLVQRLGADGADTLTAAAVACLRLVSVETVA